MMANKYEIKNLVLEADLSICNEKRDEGTTARFMPYIHRNAIIKKHYENEADFYQLYYLPFYRYIQFDNKIGSIASSSNFINSSIPCTQFCLLLFILVPISSPINNCEFLYVFASPAPHLLPNRT